MAFLRSAAAMILFGLIVPQSFGQEGQGALNLSLQEAIETLNHKFRSTPSWRPGGVQVNDPVRPMNDPDFSWAAGYIWSHPMGGRRIPWALPKSHFPAWTSNGNAESSPNGDMITQVLGSERTPINWANALNLTVSRMPASLLGTVGPLDPKDYIGSTINSFPFAQQYGVFAIHAKVPRGAGLWPKFVLLPADKSWPPSIGIMHVLGGEVGKLHVSVHTTTPQKDVKYSFSYETGMDLSADFHEYAVDWGPERISWYFDRKLVYSVATPSDLRKPCYILANLAVGTAGDWGGAPDGETVFPATMQVKYIKVWQRPEYRTRITLN